MYFEFHIPVKINAGENAIFSLVKELDNLSANRIMVITDSGIVRAGILDKVKEVFRESRKEISVVFSDIPVETSLSSLNKALALAKEEKIDSIVALGGGSVIDSAKLLSVMCGYDKLDVKDVMGVDIMPPRKIPFVVIPTTSGTGSEVTSVAVIYDESDKRKMAFASYHMMPDVAILDPDIVLAMPLRLTVSSAIDAFSHAVEAYIGIQSNPISKALAYRAINTIFRDLPLVLNNLMDKGARLSLLIAATMAGSAFSNSMVGMVHSLAHAVGSVLHVPHGEAVSLFLVPVLRLHLDVSKKELAELAMSIPNYYLSGANDAKLSMTFLTYTERFIKEIKKRASIPQHLTEYGFKETHREKIVKLALLDGSSIFSPLELNEDVANTLIDEVL